MRSGDGADTQWSGRFLGHSFWRDPRPFPALARGAVLVGRARRACAGAGVLSELCGSGNERGLLRLNLNVYVPAANASELLPVLFYVFGGGNTEGSNAQMGVPAVLARRLNAVVEVPNYRLGTLGYVVFEGAGLTGNYGVGDVLTALRFVRPLLASFGGIVTASQLWASLAAAPTFWRCWPLPPHADSLPQPCRSAAAPTSSQT